VKVRLSRKMRRSNGGSRLESALSSPIFYYGRAGKIVIKIRSTSERTYFISGISNLEAARQFPTSLRDRGHYSALPSTNSERITGDREVDVAELVGWCARYSP
jgi:hypothetical protein